MISCVLPFEYPKSLRDKWMHGQGRCIQGNHTNDTHRGDLEHAFDFKLRPGTKVLASRAGVVAAYCDHFGEGGLRHGLRPRANFVALRHGDGTYTRYVHLMRGGVLVQVGQEVAAGEVIALSGNTGYSPTPHLHFDAVKVLPQETSELWIVHPSVLPLPSVAAIFSGPLNREVEDFTTAPMIYLSPEALLWCSSSSSSSSSNSSSLGGDARCDHPPEPAEAASLLPLLSCHREVVVLVDRGGAGGKQTFVEAAATAARAVAAAPAPMPAAPGGFSSGGGVAACSGAGGGYCRCVGVVVANDRPGHEVFPMASSACGEEGMRAPFPVVMVSRESGELLKTALRPSSPPSVMNTAAMTPAGPGFGEGWAVPREIGWGPSRTAPKHQVSPPPREQIGGDGGGGRVIVSLGAADHCTAPPPDLDASTHSCSSGSSSSGGGGGGGGGHSSFTASPASSAAASFEADEDRRVPFAGAPWTAGDGYDWAGVVDSTRAGAFGTAAGETLSLYPYVNGSYPTAARARFGDGLGVQQQEVEEEAREWKRGKMLYRAKTLPVRFNRQMW